ncbi:hypothetical protein ScPMuIL_004805 [Solemya velum]
MGMLLLLKRGWRLIHWGPFLALFVIFMISSFAIICDLMWWPLHSIGGIVNFCVFLTWVFLTLYNYFLATFKGPGFVPLGWHPKKKSEYQYLQYCEMCQGYKSPRSHHCRKCDRCVMKMDHHCPWINTCVGHMNHANFSYFLFFAPCGCIHGFVILVCSVYRALNWHYYYYYTEEPVVFLGVVLFIGAMFAIGLSVGVVIAVGALFFVQLRSIIKNETGIETWIMEKARDRIRDPGEGEFKNPYYISRFNHLRQVFTWTGRPVSDGFTWPVRKGCNQYTFTIEQIKQKAEKRERTVMYTVVEKFGGSLIPITFGCRVCCNMPCTDEPRIPIKKGDKVLVTRWKRRWLYGTKVLTDKEKKVAKRVRGWFPRQCAKELYDSNDKHCEDNGKEKAE